MSMPPASDIAGGNGHFRTVGELTWFAHIAIHIDRTIFHDGGAHLIGLDDDQDLASVIGAQSIDLLRQPVCTVWASSAGVRLVTSTPKWNGNSAVRLHIAAHAHFRQAGDSYLYHVPAWI